MVCCHGLVIGVMVWLMIDATAVRVDDDGRGPLEDCARGKGFYTSYANLSCDGIESFGRRNSSLYKLQYV